MHEKTAGRVRHELAQHFRERTCLHPESPNGCGSIIDAHTVQRGQSLEAIAGDGHVLTFEPATLELTSVGWRRASTFPGFCGPHDDEFFAPLEKRDFTGSVEQIFVASYRAIAHECHQRRAAINASEAHQDILELYPAKNRLELDAQLSRDHSDRLQGLSDMEQMLAAYARMYHTGCYDDLRGCVISFTGTTSIVTTGVLTPTFDARNERMYTSVPGGLAHPLTLCVLGDDGGGHIVFSWQRGHDFAAEFVASLVCLDEARSPSVLAQFIFAHLENTFFSAAWWRDLRPAQQAKIRQHASNVRASELGLHQLALSSLVDWTVLSRRTL